MNQRITLNIDGAAHTVDADPDMPLLYALRNDVGLNNPHFGCGLAQCGALRHAHQHSQGGVQSRSWHDVRVTSALHPIATKSRTLREVRDGPVPDQLHGSKSLDLMLESTSFDAH
jgi:hypothetical protein